MGLVEATPESRGLMWNPGLPPSLVLTTHGDLWGWDHVPVPASTPSATPSVSAPLPSTGATEETQELS